MATADASTTRELLYEGRDLRVLFDRRPGDAAVVCFNWVGYRAAPDRFDADQLMARLGLPAVGVVALQDHWYCSPEMGPAGRAITEALRSHTHRLGLGYSMGGYAALRLAADLQLTHVLALSPQWSIDPGEAPWDPRYRRFAGPAQLGMGIRAGQIAGQAHVLYDPLHEVDRRHVEHIRAAGAVNLLPMPHAEHDTIKVLAGTAHFKPLLQACLAGDVAQMRSAVRQARRVSKLARACLLAHRGARRLTAGDAASARRWLGRAEAACPRPADVPAIRLLAHRLQQRPAPA